MSSETKTWVARIERVMGLLADQSGSLPTLRSRTIVLSLVLLAYERDISTDTGAEQFADFATLFVGRLRWLVSEVGSGRGVDESYLYLLEFQKPLDPGFSREDCCQSARRVHRGRVRLLARDGWRSSRRRRVQTKPPRHGTEGTLTTGAICLVLPCYQA